MWYKLTNNAGGNKLQSPGHPHLRGAAGETNVGEVRGEDWVVEDLVEVGMVRAEEAREGEDWVAEDLVKVGMVREEEAREGED
jgi:hypothetical protein